MFMSLTNRNVLSILIALMAGIALWVLPDHVRGDSQLFGANGTLLPALALALILGLSVLDAVMSVIHARRGRAEASAQQMDDARLDSASIFGILLVTIMAALFALTLRWLGYGAASLALMLALMIGTGGRSPVVILLISTLTVAVLYICLRFGMGVHIQFWPSWVG